MNLAMALEAEGFFRKEIWQQHGGSGQWEEGQVHVKAKEFFSAKAYQVHVILKCYSLPAICKTAEGIGMVLARFTVAEKLLLINVGI